MRFPILALIVLLACMAPCHAAYVPASPGDCLGGVGAIPPGYKTFYGKAPVNNQTGTSYTIAANDRCKLVSISNGSAVTVTLPQAGGTYPTGFPAGWMTFVRNRGVGTVTVTPTTSTVDGASTLVLTTGFGAIIFSDGANYFALVGSNATITSTFVLGSTTVTLGGTTTTVNGLTVGSSWLGTVTTQSGTTYTFASTDCGTTVRFTSGSAVTATLPNNLLVGCHIAAVQEGAGQVTFSAASGATLHSSSSFTKTRAQYAGVGLSVMTNSGGTSAVYDMFGDGA